MATRKKTKRRSARSRTSKRTARRPRPVEASVLTREQLWLNYHDEEKILLFATGIVFGVGLAATLLDRFIYGGLTLLVVALILIFLENSHRQRNK